MKEQKQTKTASTQVLVKAPTATRGRFFEGTIIKKFSTRVVIEFERTVYLRKYERFYKKHSKVHARIPAGMDLVVGDYIKVQECRPLSKIIHAVVVEKIRSAGEQKK
ncbi:30S ribosomal protein S17 [Candidatus Pacearchaeota archaeon]|nr:30S ribosomal protein S17 [Candidatus Pacearchaeota archaeon]